MPLDGEYEPSPTQWVRDQVDTVERTGTTDGVTIRGMPIVVMTMRGRSSGKLRKVPVMRVEHDGSYVAVASKGGAPDHPTWYANLTADPRVELHDGTVRRDVTARELEGEERQVWWDRAVAAFPDYADYATKTDRLIPVLVFEPGWQ